MRIFVAPAHLAAGELAITGDEHHYLARVRRARAGDPVELVDGEGHRARATIVRVDDAATTVRAGTVETIADLPPRVRVLVPLIKGDRMDTALEKLVEVGADELVAWPAARSVVKLEPARKGARLAHYTAAVQAAARQSGRATIPTVAIADSLAAALATLPAGRRLVLDPAADRAELPAAAADVTIASGPEGGLAPAEHDALAAAGFTALGLGPRVLRAETAPVVAVALVRAATAS
jgi:16S rRNA (uracil1498-N3)-methyltransferase